MKIMTGVLYFVFFEAYLLYSGILLISWFSGNKTKAFDDNEQVDSDVDEQEPDFDWISVAKKRKLEALEDNKALFSRLKKVN